MAACDPRRDRRRVDGGVADPRRRTRPAQARGRRFPTNPIVIVGVGVFTPANNTAIMTSVRTRQAGVAAGVLNLTRGVGTSLGVAVTALIFDLAAGGASPTSLPAALAQRGFAAAVTLLAAIAATAAAVAAVRGVQPRSRPQANEHG